MRTPSARIVVDAAVLVAAARGRKIGAVSAAAAVRGLLTTARAVEEAHRRIELGMRLPALIPVLDRIVEELAVAPTATYAPLIPAAEEALRDAVPSRNGTTRDAHILALAWIADADIWSADRDFAGAGVASWSTANLMCALLA